MRWPTSSWSETTLRRVGLATWLFQLGVLVAGVTIAVVASRSGSGSAWDTSEFLSELAFAVLVFSFPCVGTLIVLRKPRNRIGWLLLLGVGMGLVIPGLLDTYAEYGLAVAPGSLPAADVAWVLTESSWVWLIGTIGVFVILLFPDGRLPSPRWRWLPWLAGTTMVLIALVLTFTATELSGAPVAGLENPLAIPALEKTHFPIIALLVPVLPICIIASAIALVLRFRRSHGVERLQLKWLAEAGTLVAVLYLAAMVGQFLKSEPFEGADPGWLIVLQNLAIDSFLLIPVAIGVAILRHRLYDIDRVINRTLVYAALTAVLLATYLGSVLSLRVLLGPLVGESDLAVAVSTLAVAALFGPARRRIQQAVDRRFFRHRYDAARTVESFSGRLRQEVDLDSISSDLRDVVRDTVAPTQVSLWLRGPA